jgi:hypothetical protein
MDAAETGLIDRFRTCRHCQRWFHAAVAHQHHCSERCRQQFASKSDNYRKKRRDYMRQYRKDEAERDRKALKAAKRKGK